MPNTRKLNVNALHATGATGVLAEVSDGQRARAGVAAQAGPGIGGADRQRTLRWKITRVTTQAVSPWPDG